MFPSPMMLTEKEEKLTRKPYFLLMNFKPLSNNHHIVIHMLKCDPREPLLIG